MTLSERYQQKLAAFQAERNVHCMSRPELLERIADLEKRLRSMRGKMAHLNEARQTIRDLRAQVDVLRRVS